MKFVKMYDGRYDTECGKYRIQRAYRGIWEVFTQESGYKRDCLGMFYTLKKAKDFVKNIEE